MIRDALAALRARRGRTLLAALGVLAASLVVGTSVTVGYSLATGFQRSAEQAQLPDVIARFDEQPRRRIDARVSALPNLEARSYRFEDLNEDLSAGLNSTGKGAVTTVFNGRRGYKVVEGRDIRDGSTGEVVVERGVAREWDLRVGDDLFVEEHGTLRISGIAVSPDNVAFPLASTARVYVTRAQHRRVAPNVALLWLSDPDKADVTLAQARSVTFGLGKLQFITRTGVEILLSQAAGIVISLLIAFSLVALLAAGTMLAASAHADVQRRLTGLGVQRALGFGPGRIAAQQAVESALVALPAALAGIAIGALLVARPAAELIAALNELGPGATLLGPLTLAAAAVVALVVAAATWPAWRAARRPPVEILRGGDLAKRPRRRTRASATALQPAARGPRTRGTSPSFGEAGSALRGSRAAGPHGVGAPTGRPTSSDSGPHGGGSLFGLGVRFATAARARWFAAVATIAVCAGVVTLMLALASLLERLREDPGTVGKRYQLAVQLDSSQLDAARALPGVADVGERYSIDAADSFRLGEPIRLVAYPGDHTRFENPPLAEGRRIANANEVEVGLGMADALGLRPGSTLAAQIPDGGEVRFKVAGIVRALENDGRIAWIQPDKLLETRPDLTPQVVVRLEPNTDPATVTRELVNLGASLQPVGAAQTDNAAFLAVLAAVLRGVGLAVGLVCLYALIQALTVTARERRGAVALLRATGADATTIGLVLAGVAVAVAVPAAIAGVVLELTVFGPLVSRLAASFASLPLGASAGEIALVIGGLLALSVLATAFVARRVMSEPIIAGLREE
ncbi:FtsX-like permease family protein [Solirubrobacter sp. CPCC 204708]|uniref:FtsX-like permease family protein n=1 Tax=Solirubrobacter deserti TaxID=2282478 RepID=A0ABT4RJ04_9ACTN|nr:ABC transporter permease [Solirubrobacter deserti]MBE2320862.1 FtsX-like permease family protein [Solirubrobacter deserti]MDA0138497.1 FtsX-like permease family protein [Solirubrobacter deserti]